MPTPLTVTLLAVCGSCLGLALGLLLRGACYRLVRRALRLRVIDRRDHGNGLFTLVLGRPWYSSAWPLPPFLAGQSVSVSLPGTRVRRRYSLARWKAVPYRYELTVRREKAGKVSPLLAEHAIRGAYLLITQPSGEFVLPRRHCARRAVMIAGGVGITPLLAMIDAWRGRRHGFEEVYLYWQVRFESELIYREVLERHANEDGRLHLKWLVSRSPQGVPQRIGIGLLKRELGSLAGTQYFLCAGQSLLDSLVSGLIGEGVSRDAIRHERFGVPPPGDAGQWQLELGGRHILFSGHASILDALEDGGVAVATDCRTGSCGRCRLAVLSGQVRHFIRPEFAVSKGHALACCSVPVTNLVIAQPGCSTR